MLKPSPNRRKSAWLSPRVLLNALRARLGTLLLATALVFACLASLIYTLPGKPTTPGLVPDLLISLLLALAAGVAIVFLVEFFTPGHIRSYAALRSYTAGMN